MKTTAAGYIHAFFATIVLAGCGIVPAQNHHVARVGADAPLSASDGWARIVEMDRDAVRHGQLPPEIIQYDLQIAQLIPEGQEIMVSHDQAMARTWSEKFNAVNVARNNAVKMAMRDLAKNDATPGVWTTKKPDPCLSPMGTNTCTAPSAQQGGVIYTVGPGGIGASMGGLIVGPGGIGY